MVERKIILTVMELRDIMDMCYSDGFAYADDEEYWKKENRSSGGRDTVSYVRLKLDNVLKDLGMDTT